MDDLLDHLSPVALGSGCVCISGGVHGFDGHVGLVEVCAGLVVLVLLKVQGRLHVVVHVVGATIDPLIFSVLHA